jgi:hypothetical protein
MTDGEPVIETPRLALHHLIVEGLLRLFYEPEDHSICESGGYANLFGVLIDDNWPLASRVTQVEKNPSHNKWLVRFVVLKETSRVIGSTSLHRLPDEH